MKATATVRERLEDFVTTFENPEISAMAAINRILEDLPDEAARLRVMRWAFGKYGEEFKRPLTVPATVVPLKPTRVPPLVVADATPVQPADFDRQVAELCDMFSDRPDGVRLARPRER